MRRPRSAVNPTRRGGSERAIAGSETGGALAEPSGGGRKETIERLGGALLVFGAGARIAGGQEVRRVQPFWENGWILEADSLIRAHDGWQFVDYGLGLARRGAHAR